MAQHPGNSGGEPLPSYVPHQYDSWVLEAAKGTGLPVDVVAAQINEESGFQPGVTSPAGAEGIAQFEPATYAGVGGTGSEYVAANELAPYIKLTRQNLTWAKGDVQKALAAYNAGQGNWQAGIGYADTILSNANAKGLNVQPGSGSGVNPNVGKGLGGTTSNGPGFGDVFRGALTGIGVDLGQSDVQAYDNAGAIDSLGGIAAGLAALAAPFTKIADGLDWLFHPNHIIRIVAGVGGGVALGAGVWSMTHVGGASVGGEIGGVPVSKDFPTPSLPIAVGLTGLGFLGLYVAFHNLPDSIKTFPDFVGYLSGEIRNPTGAKSG